MRWAGGVRGRGSRVLPVVSMPVVHWPVIGRLFVESKGEPSCLFRVVTRRGWCGSGSTLRWLRSMRCASGLPRLMAVFGATGSMSSRRWPGCGR